MLFSLTTFPRYSLLLVGIKQILNFYRQVLSELSFPWFYITPGSSVKTGSGMSSGMRTFRILFDLRSDWLMGKWSVLSGREKRSRD